jgi:uncharacterized membrane protein YciS (DUF1049 family)
MMTLGLLLILSIAALVGVVFLLGFRLGGEHWQSELARVRVEAAQAERQMHHLTREAFITMAEQAQRHTSLRRHEGQ